MKLSAQEEYGLRCLLHMVRQGEGASLSIPEISRAEGLSVPNVAKLMRILRMGGFVKSVRGQSGGYILARPAAEISVSKVLETLGGRLYGPSFCSRHSGLNDECVHNADCGIRSVWSTLQRVIESVLADTTLADLVRNESEMQSWIQLKVQQVLPAHGAV
jgi:Rrf2 family transcriptional regulator, iron-sulfur cluster assembly transcription factor